jgi:hypothetical protein
MRKEDFKLMNQNKRTTINMKNNSMDITHIDESIMQSRRTTETKATPFANKSQYSQGQALSTIKYIVKTIDGIIHQICQRTPSIPLPIRFFALALYHHHRKQGRDKVKVFRIIGKYLFSKWLGKFGFEDMVVNGLVKVYNLPPPNCLENIKIMNQAFSKVMLMDDHHFEDEILNPINDLIDSKRDQIFRFYQELIDIPAVAAQPKKITVHPLLDPDYLFNKDSPLKFQHHSMCLSVEMINFLYKFLKENADEFPHSRQSIEILTSE